MKCIVHPRLNHDFIEEQVKDVLKRLKGEEGLDFSFVFIQDKKDLPAIVDQLSLGKDSQKEFQSKVQNEGSSNFSINDQDFLIIDLDKPFLQNNPAALRGLIAHELIHTVHREQEQEEKIQKAAMARSEQIIKELAQRGYTKDEAMRFFREVVSTAVFSLKDIIGNTELIQQGFTEDLKEYYSQMLNIDDYCPLPRFYSEEEKLSEVEEAIAFELELMPAWIPFEGRDEGQKIRDRIAECYQQNIPETSEQMNTIAELYRQTETMDDFIDVFFDQVIESAFSVIDAKL